MTSLGTALLAGYNVAQLLGFLSNNFPNIGRRITEARRLGYDTKKIVEFFSDMTTEDLQKYENSDEVKGQNPWIDADKLQREQSAYATIKKQAPKVAALAAIPIAAFTAYRALRTPESPAIQPDEISQVGEQIGFQPKGIGFSPQQALPEPEPIQPETQPEPIQPQPEPIQPEPEPVPQAPIEPQEEPPNPKALELIDDRMKYGNIIKQLVEKNESIETIEGVINNLLGEKGRNWLKTQTKDPLSKIIKDYLTLTKEPTKEEPIQDQLEPTTETPQLPEELPKEETPQQPPIKEPIKPIKEKEVKLTPDKQPKPTKFDPGKDKKGDVVQTSGGEVGTIEGLDGSGALVNVNGKIKKVQFEDLEGQTQEVQDAKIVIDPKDVPEEDRSAALGFVLTPPSRRDILISHGASGKFYRYWKKDGSPIDEKIVSELKVGQRFPISTGRTYMGGWDADDEDSRGTVAYHSLTMKGQKYGEEDKKTKMMNKKTKDDAGKVISEEEIEVPLDYWYEEYEDTYTHGYIKKFLKLLRAAIKAFRPKKKRKKKK